MLDLFFRKYAWTATLALLFAAAWIAAKTVNTLVGVAIRPRPCQSRTPESIRLGTPEVWARTSASTEWI